MTPAAKKRGNIIQMHKITVIPEIGWILVRKEKDIHGVIHEFLDASRSYCQPLQDHVEPIELDARRMAEYMMEAHPNQYVECYPVYH